jgi:hypothetical protein
MENTEKKPEGGEKPVHFFSWHNSIIILLCLACLSLYLFTANILLTSFSASAETSSRHISYIGILMHKKESEQPLVAGYIKGWMTFAYIDHLYNLPPTYLQTSFNITDHDFPNISLNDYAEDHTIDRETFINEVIKKVSDLLPSDAKSTTTVPLMPSLLPESSRP